MKKIQKSEDNDRSQKDKRQYVKSLVKPSRNTKNKGNNL
jgi:hypothetical protein